MNITNDPTENPLFTLQETIYASKNFTRRRLHQSRLAWVRNAISKYSIKTSSPSRGIEYGPGSGIYLPNLATTCEKAIAADIEKAYLQGIQPLLNKYPNLELVIDNIENSQFETGAMDFVLCSEVLEHVPNPELALKNIYRILKPGGIAVVTTPQKYSLMEMSCKIALLPGFIQLVRLIYREPILETGHISLRTANQFKKALQDCNFYIEDYAKFGLYVPFLAELGGGQFIEFLERYLQNPKFSWMLWTQAFVLKKPLG